MACISIVAYVETYDFGGRLLGVACLKESYFITPKCRVAKSVNAQTCAGEKKQACQHRKCVFLIATSAVSTVHQIILYKFLSRHSIRHMSAQASLR